MRKKGANIGVCVLAVTVAWLFAGTAWVRAEDKAEAQEIVDKAKVTFGLQIGGEAAETLILVMTQKAVDSLYTSSVKLGGDTSIALGPVGFGAKSNVTADFLAFSESKGIYGGINLEGSVLGVRDSLNKAYYGEEVSPVQIIVEKKVRNEGSASLRAALKEAAK